MRRLGLPAEQQQKLASKAAELVRLSTAKLGAGGLGQVRLAGRQTAGSRQWCCHASQRRRGGGERRRGPHAAVARRLSLPAHIASNPPPLQGELCKGAACVELAAMALGVTVDASLVQRLSGVNDKVYRNAKAALQKILGVGSRATARELCVQFGCARHHDGVRACLAAFKERFVRSLPAVQQGHVDFSRAVFLAAAFYLVRLPAPCALLPARRH